MENAMQLIAELMSVSARTAPKTAGKDFVTVDILDKSKLAPLADAMEIYGKTSGKHNFDRDAAGVRASSAVVLIGIKDAKPLGLDCGACGYSKCSQLPAAMEGNEFKGPFCAYRMLDLGIALGSAVKTAQFHNADNRIMYRVGVIARKLGLTRADYVIGIPISATGKNIFFDR